MTAYLESVGKYIHTYIFQFISYWGKPERAPHLSNGVPMIYICMYNVYLVRHSVNKCPRVLIHLNSFNLAMRHQFRKCHHVQIIKTASILRCNGHTSMQWAYSTTRSLLMLLLTQLTIQGRRNRSGLSGHGQTTFRSPYG